MSCNLVSDDTILLIAAIRHEYTWQYTRLDLNSLFHIRQTVNTLIDANLASVNARKKNLGYELEERPSINIPDTWETVDMLRNLLQKYSAIEKIKILQYLEYNCCEVEDFENTTTKRILNSVLEKLIPQLEGWNEAPWGI